MKARAVSTRRFVAAVTICSLLVAPGSLGVLRGAFPNGPAAPNQGAAAKPSPMSTAPADGGWPRSYITTAGARSEGTQRTKDAGAVRSGASASSGSYRASGGGSRRR
jgi:hypothetical protein